MDHPAALLKRFRETVDLALKKGLCVLIDATVHTAF
jgi:hypothetical protein